MVSTVMHPTRCHLSLLRGEVVARKCAWKRFAPVIVGGSSDHHLDAAKDPHQQREIWSVVDDQPTTASGTAQPDVLTHHHHHGAAVCWPLRTVLNGCRCRKQGERRKKGQKGEEGAP